MSAPLQTNRAGEAYEWPDTTWTAIWASVDTAPENELYPHHFGRACANLAWPFQQKPIITAFLEAYSEAVTDVETSAYQVRDSANLDTATGDALRIAAALVRAPWKSTWSDATVRKLIYFTADALALDTGWSPWLTLVGQMWGSIDVGRNDDGAVSIAFADPDADLYADLGTDTLTAMALEQLPAGVAIDLVDASAAAYGLHFADSTALPAYGTPGYRLGDSTDLNVGDTAFDHNPI